MSSTAASKQRGKRTAAKAIEPPTLVVEDVPPVISCMGGEAPQLPPPIPPLSTAKKPRSSKKTPPVVAIVTPAGITGSFLTEQRPLIAHLPVSSAELSFDATNTIKSGAQPSAFDSTGESFSYLENIPEDACATHNIAPITKPLIQNAEPKCKLATNYSEKLMVLFQDSNRYKKLPEKTEIACFWCCHSFNSQPIAIPSHILDEIWHMYGNFCSPECATAYLFKERIDAHVQWERYALLNSIYSDDAKVEAGSPVGIRPAPPREVLRMFGGSMDISEYRALVHEKKLRVDVLTPPMVSIIQTMDTKPIDFYDQNLKNVFIRNDIQHKYNAPGAQGLRLRRSKPVKSRESTVEWAMQITTTA
jgi:hypothetical protein